MIIPPNVVSHRANLFSAICQIASSEIGAAFELPTREQRLQRPAASTNELKSHPRFGQELASFARKRPRIVGRSVFFGANSIDLSGAPLTLNLLIGQSIQFPILSKLASRINPPFTTND